MTITDASRLTSLFDGSRLRLARETRGLSQNELAAKVGSITAPAISQYENGVIKPSTQTLSEISAALSFPVAFFTIPFESTNHPAFFRSLRGAPAKEKAAARALAEIASQLVAGLEKYVQLPSVNLPRARISIATERPTIENLAKQVRTSWGISAGPIPNVIAELERRGFVTVRLPLDVSEIDAFSVPFQSRPVVVLSADKSAADRSRFDAAHELGHLVMHETNDDSEHRRIEQQAHWFAAAFLAPTSELESELPKSLDWPALASLKRRWGLSMASLLMRTRDLGRISEAEYTRGMRHMSLKGWRKVEPVQLGAPERPLLLGRAVAALATTGMSLESLAEECGLPSELVEQIVGASRDERPRVEI